MAVQRVLSEWFSKRGPSSVGFRENMAPPSDPHARYVVRYEVVFEPLMLDQARVEIWETAEDNVAIGLERTRRIAQRLGVNGGTDRFAAGHEPLRVAPLGLIAIMEAIANGEVMVSAMTLPWLGVVSTRAIAPREVIQALVDSGYDSEKWIASPPRILIPGTRMLRFLPW